MPNNIDNSSNLYLFNHRDKKLIVSARLLLIKVTQASSLLPAQLLSIAKLRHVLEKIPNVTSCLDVRVSVISPRRYFDDVETYHWYDVAIQDEILTISSGGHFYRPSTGGDTFITMTWNAMPGEKAEYADYLDQLRIVPDVFTFEEAVARLDLSVQGYNIEVEDPDNSFLDDLDEAEEEIQDDNSKADEIIQSQEPWIVIPCDEADRRLAARIDDSEVNGREADFAMGAETCDFCGCKLIERGLYVDGRVRGDILWANMCAPCFEQNGEGIAWGKGQLFALQSDGTWRLVAGFSTDEDI